MTGLAKLDDAKLALLSDGETGLDEIDALGSSTPTYTLNKAEDKTRWFNSDTEETYEKVRCHLLYLHVSNLYSIYSNKEMKTKVICSSDDRVTGMHETEGRLDCKGCKYAEWREEDDGVRRRKCGEVATFAAFDVENMQPFIVKFRKGALKMVETHLRRYHKRRLKNGKTVPLYFLEVELSAKLAPSGNYAIPSITVVNDDPPIETLEAMKAAAEDAKMAMGAVPF